MCVIKYCLKNKHENLNNNSIFYGISIVIYVYLIILKKTMQKNLEEGQEKQKTKEEATFKEVQVQEEQKPCVWH